MGASEKSSTDGSAESDSASSGMERRSHFDEHNDKEEEIGLEKISTETKQEQQPPTNGSALVPTKSLRSLHSHRSYPASDGYTCFAEDNERPNKSTGNTDGGPFLVQWDGDADPMNPRSMSKFRRWIIVLIVSSSSLCV